jgi:hypothetical protein
MDKITKEAFDLFTDDVEINFADLIIQQKER